MTRLTPVLLIVIAAALAACAGTYMSSDATFMPTILAAVQQTPEITPTLPAPTQQPANVGLTQTGPWLLMHAESGLWAINADGAGLTQLYAGGIEAPGNLATAVSPSGGHIAFITSSPPDGGNESLTWAFDLHLNILNVLSGASFEATRLNTDETRPDPDDIPGDPAVEGYRAIIEADSLAWSPDGLTLAFMGMIDGPTSDLYTYNLPTGEITRLTDGPSQGYQPSWSPSATYVLHAGVTTFGTGAGYLMDGVWAARADGSEVIELYESESYGEEFVGWLDDSTFLVFSWAPECGAYNLRRFDIESGHSASLTQFFDGPAPAIDFASGAVLITVGEYAAECNEDNNTPGAFLLSLNELGGTLVWPGEAYAPVWSEAANAFFVTVEGGAIRITPDGNVTELPAPVAGTPLVAPGGATWAWFSDGFFDARTGLWLGPVGSEPPAQVFTGPVYHALWSPDGTRLFFFTDDGLMMLTPADGAINLVGEGLFPLNPISAVWVNP